MANTEASKSNNISAKQEEEAWDEHKFQELVQSLPVVKYVSGDVYLYKGCWIPSYAFKGAISFQEHFRALDSDIILTTIPKSGTTWLKALTFSIVNRHKFSFQNNPLHGSGPHQLVRHLECGLYMYNPRPNFENYSQSYPRIFSTHLPFAALPTSIKHTNSKAKIVYLCRNPMDVFISYWHFSDYIRPANMEGMHLDESFELFSKGICSFGPFWDHALGFWKASQENPNKILFLKYEDLKENTLVHVKNLASFLGLPFSEKEEKKGVIEEIVKFCSFDILKEVEANKSGYMEDDGNIFPNSAYFRKGQVGDWASYHLKAEMIELLKRSMHENLDGSGLTFKLS